MLMYYARRRLEVDVRALKDPSPNQRLAFLKRRTALLKRIHRFCEVQKIYMPALRSVLPDTGRQVFDGNGEQLPEATRLFMPSELASAVVRGKVCASGLPEVEAQMQQGEAQDALEAVRQGLRTRTMTNRYKLRNFTGQGMMTKGQGILRQINVKIHIAKLRYRYSRAALLALQGHGGWEEALRVLNDDDVRALNERALTAEEKAQNEHWAELGGAVIKGGVARAAGVARGKGAHRLSWIWYTVSGGEEEDDERLHDGKSFIFRIYYGYILIVFYEALRVEWCKAFGCTRRFDEEVQHLRAEMGRTIAAGYTKAAEWEGLAEEEHPGASEELAEGRRAYAYEQADTELKRCEDLTKRWRGILVKADVYLAGEAELVGDDVVTVELDVVDELDEEEEEARLAADEEAMEGSGGGGGGE